MGPEERYGDARNEEKAGVLIGILEDRISYSSSASAVSAAGKEEEHEEDRKEGGMEGELEQQPPLWIKDTSPGRNSSWP